MTSALYIHIPFCKSKCAYCDFFSIPCSGEIEEAYIDLLLKELAGRCEQFSVSDFSSIYIGGGTPSLLKPYQLSKLFDGIKCIGNISENCEITLECNPDDISEDLILSAYDSGINRLSVGLQAMEDKILSTVGRRCNREINLKALKLLEKYWISRNTCKENRNYRLSVDFICGLPYQTKESFFSGLNEILQFNVDHISLYSLTLEEGTPLYDAVEKKRIVLPDDDVDEWWIEGRDFLEKNKFFQYEVSNFSLKGCESRHNKTYWKMNPYIGIGAGACGTVNNFRYTNSNDVKNWLNGCTEQNEKLSIKTQIFEFLMMGFRMNEGVSGEEFYKRFNCDIEDYIEPSFYNWKKRGLSDKKNGYYFLTWEGILFLNSFLEEIL